VVVAGPNGAGKTTFAQEYLKFHDYEYLSADNIANEIAPDKLEEVRVQAGRLFFQKLFSLIEQKEDFVVESTLSGLGFQRIIRQLRRSGYSITIIFTFLETPEICITRIRERVLKGGHDKWYLSHNSSEHFQKVAFGEKENYTINNQELFNLFMQGVECES
jgi:predicted ABC-type ATPase